MTTIAILSFAETFYYTKAIPFNFSYLKILFSILVAYFVTSYLTRFVSFLPSPVILVISSFIIIISYIALLFLTKSFEKEDITILRVIRRRLLRFSSK